MKRFTHTFLRKKTSNIMSICDTIGIYYTRSSSFIWLCEVAEEIKKRKEIKVFRNTFLRLFGMYLRITRNIHHSNCVSIFIMILFLHSIFILCFFLFSISSIIFSVLNTFPAEISFSSITRAGVIITP